MRLVSLLYHDVVGTEGFAASGPAGGDADIYKLRRADFIAHVDAVSAVASPLGTAPVLLEAPAPFAVLWTFDDGGVGAHAHTAPILEERGWRGHFFITTDWIGRPGFLNPAQLRELHARGHVIGSHSRSHPMRMSSLADAVVRAEWSDSVARLEDVLGEPVRTASVPGGFYSQRVADHAFAAGIGTLFTSEPTATVRRLGDRTVLGRFSIMRDDAAAKARDFAADRWPAHFKQAAFWEAKKVLKAVGGEAWLRFRRRVLRTR